MTLRRVLACIFLLFCRSCFVARAERSAYEILGVARDASQEEIRRQYRKLCLKLHPDKNVHLRPRDRQKCEEMFKTVQHANAQIGDEASRKRYDMEVTSPFGTTTGYSGGMDRAAQEAFYRSFYRSMPRRSTRTPFYVNGIDISELFSGRTPWSPTQVPHSKSIYVQKVKVPLQDLYAGRQNVEFMLKDNVWKRYRAAFRGGAATSVLYQGLVLAIPLLRVSIAISMLVGAALIHTNLPRPTKTVYDVNIQRGWKSGTKLTFKEVEPGFDVVFIIEEQKHGSYVRVGNDLHTDVMIRKKQAKHGCTIEIESLGGLEAPILVRLRPNEIKLSGQKVTIKGRGWPIRKGGGHGNLVVTVNILNKLRATRSATNKRATSIYP
jgi:DnaJ-class molecular chaperone